MCSCASYQVQITQSIYDTTGATYSIATRDNCGPHLYLCCLYQHLQLVHRVGELLVALRLRYPRRLNPYLDRLCLLTPLALSPATIKTLSYLTRLVVAAKLFGFHADKEHSRDNGLSIIVQEVDIPFWYPFQQRLPVRGRPCP